MSPEVKIRFGYPKQWRAFARRNPRFIERAQRLDATLGELFFTRRTLSAGIDQLIFLLGVLTTDDFREIQLVCGNGEGFAAEKLLRSMYERVWTLLYLKKHPEEMTRYLDWYHINRHKLLVSTEKYLPDANPSAEHAAEIREEFKEAKERLGFKKCKACGTERPISWATKNPVDSAKEFDFESFVVPAYYLPLEHAHPNIGGMTQRVVMTDGEIEVKDRFDPERCDRVLVAAHGLLLHAVKGCIEQLGLDESRYAHLVSDYEYAWQHQPG